MIRHKELFIILLLLLPYEKVETQELFNIKQTLEYALKNNKTLLNSQLQREDAQRVIDESIATGLPQVSLAASVKDNLKLPVSIVPANTFDPDASEDELLELEFGIQYQSAVNINASQMIFDGSFFVGLEAARRYKDLMSKGSIKTKYDVIELSLKAFYNVLINKERIKLVNQNISMLEKTLEETKLIFENGFVEKTDVDRIRVQLNNIKTQKQDFVKNLELSYAILKFQIGMPIKESIELEGSLTDFDLTYDEGVIMDFNYDNRIEIQELKIQKELFQLDLKNIRYERLPKIYLVAGYGYLSGSNTFGTLWKKDNWFSNYFVGANINIPIFNGFSRNHTIQRKKIRIASLENNNADLQNSIDHEILKAKKTLKNSIAKKEVQKQNVKLAKEIYEITSIKYKNGTSSNIELLDSETAFRESEVFYFTAMYETIFSKIELDKALGQLDRYETD